MAEKITYTDKESLVTDPTIDEKNKVTDANMNEIKSSVNANADQLDETIVIGDSNITNNTKAVINEVQNIPYINSEIAIGPTNPQNQRTWFKQGKNLFDKNIANIQTLYPGSNGSTTSGSLFKSVVMNCKPNTTYAIKRYFYESSDIIVASYSSFPVTNTSWTNRAAGTTGNTITITTGANDYFLLIYIYYGSTAATLQSTLDGLIVQYGNTITSYETYVNTSINIDEQDIYNKPVVLVTTQNVTYDSSSQDGSAVFTLQFPTGFNASNTIVVSLGWKYHSDTNNEWRFGTIAGSDVKPNPFFVTFNYNNTPGIRVRFDDVEAEVTYSADFKIVLMKVD